MIHFNLRLFFKKMEQTAPTQKISQLTTVADLNVQVGSIGTMLNKNAYPMYPMYPMIALFVSVQKAFGVALPIYSLYWL